MPTFELTMYPNQGQANVLATFDLDQIHEDDQRLLGVIRRDLGRARNDWFDLPEESVNALDVGTAAHHLLRHQLFDLLVDSVGFPSNPDRVHYPKVPLQKPLTNHLQKVCATSTAIHDFCTDHTSFDTDCE